MGMTNGGRPGRTCDRFHQELSTASTPKGGSLLKQLHLGNDNRQQPTKHNIQDHHHHHQFLNCEGRWGTTDDFATSFLHFSMFSTALWDLPNSRPVHSWCCLSTSSSVCLVFLPLSLCLARWFWSDLMNGKHDHTTAVCVSSQWSGGLRVVRIACWILARTSSLVTWSLYEMCSILR